MKQAIDCVPVWIGEDLKNSQSTQLDDVKDTKLLLSSVVLSLVVVCLFTSISLFCIITF